MEYLNLITNATIAYDHSKTPSILLADNQYECGILRNPVQFWPATDGH